MSRFGKIALTGLVVVAFVLGALALYYRPSLPPPLPVAIQAVPTPTSVVETCPFHSFDLAAFKRVIGTVTRQNPTLGTLNSMDYEGQRYLSRHPSGAMATFTPFTLTDPTYASAVVTVTAATTADAPDDRRGRLYGRELYLRVRFRDDPGVSINGRPVFYDFLSADLEPICRDHNLLEAVGHALWFGARAQN